MFCFNTWHLLLWFCWWQIYAKFFYIWTACHYFPLFVVGMKLREGSLTRLCSIPLISWPIVSIVLFMCCEFLKGMYGFQYKVVNVVFVSLFLHIVSALMAFLVLQKIATLWNWQQSRWFMFLEKHNVTVYLLHEQIVYFMIVALNGMINPYLHIGANFVVAMAVSLVIAAILSRFKVMRVLIGMK